MIRVLAFSTIRDASLEKTTVECHWFHQHCYPRVWVCTIPAVYVYQHMFSLLVVIVVFQNIGKLCAIVEIVSKNVRNFPAVTFPIFTHSVDSSENVKMFFGKALENWTKNCWNVVKFGLNCQVRLNQKVFQTLFHVLYVKNLFKISLKCKKIPKINCHQKLMLQKIEVCKKRLCR